MVLQLLPPWAVAITANYGNYGGQNPINMSNTSQSASGNAAVDLAKKYLGRDSIGMKGDLPNFTAAGGVTNNCADFVKLLS